MTKHIITLITALAIAFGVVACSHPNQPVVQEPTTVSTYPRAHYTPTTITDDQNIEILMHGRDYRSEANVPG